MFVCWIRAMKIKDWKEEKVLPKHTQEKQEKGVISWYPGERWCPPKRGGTHGTFCEGCVCLRKGGGGHSTGRVWERSVECKEHLQSLEPLPSGGGGPGRRQPCITICLWWKLWNFMRPVNTVVWFLITINSLFTHPLSHGRSCPFNWFS